MPLIVFRLLKDVFMHFKNISRQCVTLQTKSDTFNIFDKI